MPDEPQDTVVTIPGVEVFRAGVWNDDAYSVNDLHAMVQASMETGLVPPVKLGHVEDANHDALLKHEGLPAFGFVRNLRVQGQSLLADLTNIPRRLGELIKKGLYPARSAEVLWGYTKNGKTWPRVLSGLALLGSAIPAIPDLRAIEALFADADGEVHFVTFSDSQPQRSTTDAGWYPQERPMANDSKHATTRVHELVKQYQAVHPEFVGKYKEAMAIVLDLPENEGLKNAYALERLQ